MAARKTLPTSRPQQERLHTLIGATPGIHIRRLAQLLGVSWNTCLHHLRTMEAEGTVVRRKVQGRVCYFDRAHGAVQGKDAICLLRDPENRRLARQVLERPGHKQVELARALGMGTSTVHRRVTRLEEAGLFSRVPGERSLRVFPTDGLGPLAQGLGLFAGDDPFGPAPAVPVAAPVPVSAVAAPAIATPTVAVPAVAAPAVATPTVALPAAATPTPGTAADVLA